LHTLCPTVSFNRLMVKALCSLDCSFASERK
jgi:hypothetical protein